jgi:5'-3' exoribonuclease 1
MGVPYFFKWLKTRYPLSYQLVGEEQIPGVDCLYLDMNGIVYKCVSDESIFFRDQLNAKCFEDIWADIIGYTDHIVNLVRPSRLLFIGFDGVAPRAKMNHQRARRFRAATRDKEIVSTLAEYTSEASSQKFIANSICPGTEFTHELNRHFQFYILHKLKHDDKWRNLNVVFSGFDVPGECEHKLLEYMRECQQAGLFSPDLLHCIYGADADLIMLTLGLGTDNILIVRE